MAVKDLDTPLHRLMEYVAAEDYARLPIEFIDFVKEDFDKRVQMIQSYSTERRSFIFLNSFIEKVRRKQYKAAKERLTSARQEYEKFMLQYESLPPSKVPPAIKPHPHPKDNELKPIIIPNEETSPRYWAPPPSKAFIQPVYFTIVPRTEIEEILEPPLETKRDRAEPNETPSTRVAVNRGKEANHKQIVSERVSQYEVLPWRPAPEDVRPNFTNRGDAHDQKNGTLLRLKSELFSRGYKAYKQSLEASVLLRDGKLQKTDIYSRLRPSKLAERFIDLYFKDYANAFEELMSLGIKERNTVFCLLQIVTQAYEHCRAAVELNLGQNRKPEEDTSWKNGLYGANSTDFQLYRDNQIEQRFIKATQMLPFAREDFLQRKYPRILPRNIVTGCPGAITYAEKCIEICWWMCVLEPPIVMEWVPDRVRGQFYEPFNRDRYGSYTKVGSHHEHTVWPVLLRYKYGPVLSKGIAQGINPFM